MDTLLGEGNKLLDYVVVVALYGAMYILMRHAHSRIELNFQKTFRVLYFSWSVSVFVGNYLFYKLGIMSFLPWLNNFTHTFVWIGCCLGFLYAGCYQKPFWEQFLLFSIFSFIIKVAERQLLGTWELDYFFIIEGNIAYLIGWSLMDGLYPVISVIGLKIISKYVEGIIVP